MVADCHVRERRWTLAAACWAKQSDTSACNLFQTLQDSGVQAAALDVLKRDLLLLLDLDPPLDGAGGPEELPPTIFCDLLSEDLLIVR